MGERGARLLPSLALVRQEPLPASLSHSKHRQVDFSLPLALVRQNKVGGGQAGQVNHQPESPDRPT